MPSLPIVTVDRAVFGSQHNHGFRLVDATVDLLDGDLQTLLALADAPVEPAQARTRSCVRLTKAVAFLQTAADNGTGQKRAGAVVTYVVMMSDNDFALFEFDSKHVFESFADAFDSQLPAGKVAKVTRSITPPEPRTFRTQTGERARLLSQTVSILMLDPRCALSVSTNEDPETFVFAALSWMPRWARQVLSWTAGDAVALPEPMSLSVATGHHNAFDSMETCLLYNEVSRGILAQVAGEIEAFLNFGPADDRDCIPTFDCLPSKYPEPQELLTVLRLERLVRRPQDFGDPHMLRDLVSGALSILEDDSGDLDKACSTALSALSKQSLQVICQSIPEIVQILSRHGALNRIEAMDPTRSTRPLLEIVAICATLDDALAQARQTSPVPTCHSLLTKRNDLCRFGGMSAFEAKQTLRAKIFERSTVLSACGAAALVAGHREVYSAVLTHIRTTGSERHAILVRIAEIAALDDPMTAAQHATRCIKSSIHHTGAFLRLGRSPRIPAANRTTFLRQLVHGGAVSTSDLGTLYPELNTSDQRAPSSATRSIAGRENVRDSEVRGGQTVSIRTPRNRPLACRARKRRKRSRHRKERRLATTRRLWFSLGLALLASAFAALAFSSNF